MKSKNACGSRERERERESRNLEKIEEREGLYSKNRPLFICTAKLTQGRSVKDNASNILKMQSIRKNNRMKSILNAVSGITLIALVVTIVVLLILASVSITVVFGDNGILQLAKEAGEKTNEAVKNDISSIGEIEDILHETQTGIKVDKVTDANPGELEESKGNIYTINSIEDLVFFAHEVTTGHETYVDKTVKLGLSLDFASTKSYVDANRTDYGKYGYDGELKKLLNESGFIPIGTQEGLTDEEISKKSFHGTFDGDSKTIYNLKIKEEISDANKFKGTGLFIVNYGTIKGLGVENANIDVDVESSEEEWKWIGVLAAFCGSDGKIDKCHTSGKVNVSVISHCDVGGLAGATGVGGTISNSYSDVDILVGGEVKNEVLIGLVVGSCNKNGTVKNVYSKGNIYPVHNSKAGLVVGSNDEASMTSNSYTIGRIKADESYNLEIGLRTFGTNGGEEHVLNCYYLENRIEPAYNGDNNLIYALGDQRTEQEMKKQDFIDLLNNGQEDKPWKQDTNNINDGYPILSWQ